MCLETLLLLEREVVEEGRGESLAAWGCEFLLGRLQQGQTSPLEPCGMVWVPLTGYFPWEACWGRWRVAEAGLADLLGKMEMLKYYSSAAH